MTSRCHGAKKFSSKQKMRPSCNLCVEEVKWVIIVKKSKRRVTIRFIYVFVQSRSPVVLKLKENAVETIVIVQSFAPDCSQRSESDTYRSLVSLAGKKADEYKVDSSIEVSKDFIVIYFFKLKNAVRPKVRYICTIDC